MIAENVNEPAASEPQPPVKPQIVEVEYGFTKNMGNFESQRMSVRALVPWNVQPEEVLASAQQWVSDHLSPTHGELSDAAYRLSDMQRQASELQSRVDELNSLYTKLRKTLSELGLILPENVEELPF